MGYFFISVKFLLATSGILLENGGTLLKLMGKTNFTDQLQ